jgi:hypothetical protein
VCCFFVLPVNRVFCFQELHSVVYMYCCVVLVLLAFENVLVCLYSVNSSLSVDFSNLMSGALECVYVKKDLF